MDKQKPTLQTVDRALELIDLMASSSEKMSVIEISKALNVTRTGAYNLLNSLMARNFIEKDTSSNKYHIGYRFLELGSYYRYQYPFVLAAERGIYTLSRKWKHQINLSIYKSPCFVVFLLTKASEGFQRAAQRVVLPAYTTASGKLLMSHLPQEQLLEDLAQTELKKYARGTITDREQLLASLAEIREAGYSVEREESNNQRGCIACPILDISGETVAAVSMFIPLDDMEENFAQYLDGIQGVCVDISMELGYNPYQK